MPGLQIEFHGCEYAKPVKTYRSYSRFVAVLDVLGMREWLAREAPTVIAEQLGKALAACDELSSGETVRAPGEPPGPKYGPIIGTTHFSDTLLAWSPDDSWDSFVMICSAVGGIVRVALQNGVPLRGAIALGDAVCCARDLRFVGPPIAEAYTWAECKRHYRSVGVDITPATLGLLRARERTHPGFDKLGPFFALRGHRSHTLVWYDECLFLNHWSHAAFLHRDPQVMFSLRQLPTDQNVQLKIDQMMAFFLSYKDAEDRAFNADFNKAAKDRVQIQDPMSLNLAQRVALDQVRLSRAPF